MLKNFEDIKEQMMRLGNASHDLRNYFALSKRIDIPELLAIDSITGQIENKARLFISHITNPIDPHKMMIAKNMLLSFYRANNFFLRNLKTDVRQLGYELMPSDHLQKVIQSIDLQNNIIKYVETSLNSAQSMFSLSNIFGNSSSSSSSSSSSQPEYKLSEVYKNLDFNRELNLSQCYTDASVSNLIYAAQQTCNKAHSIQNIICYYQPISSIAVQANEINSIAGNVEDQFRTILSSLAQDRNDSNAIKQKIKQSILLIEPQIQQLIQTVQNIGSSQHQDVIRIQKLSDQILLSTYLFNDITQLNSIKSS